MKNLVFLSLSLFALLNLMLFPIQAVPLALSSGTVRANWLTLMSDDQDEMQRFHIASSTFENNKTVPASMVFSGTLGSNCIGGNMSPELKWTKAVPWTRSYAVVAYDVTANFTHWGVYNIPPDVTELPANAGVATSSLAQITDDAGNVGYVGPCPPPDIVPNGIHKYLFTVYALDTTLDLPAFPPGFPAPAETLFRAMIGHVIESATVTGLFSCDNAPTASCT